MCNMLSTLVLLLKNPVRVLGSTLGSSDSGARRRRVLRHGGVRRRVVGSLEVAEAAIRSSFRPS